MFNFKISITIDPSAIIGVVGDAAQFVAGNTIGAAGHIIDAAGATTEFITGNTIGAAGHIIDLLPKAKLTVNIKTGQSYYFKNKV
jgi:hypothetical protein